MTQANRTEKGFVRVRGTKLYYEMAGEGHPLLLLHGGLLDHRMWEQQFEAFARHYRVVRYDIRGFGASEMSGTAYADERDLYDLLVYLDIDKTYLLGLSLGGSIAIDFTLEHPQKVAGLILAAASVGGYDNYSPEAIERQHRIEAAIEQRDVPRLFELWASDPMMPQADENPEAHRRYRAMLKDYTFVHYLNPAPQQELDPPAIEQLMEIRVPTLVLVGDQDTLESQAIAELFEVGILDVKKVTLPGARHMLNMERPETFNRAVLTFLHRLDNL
ncbi:MAG: alpha/beta fold hydrolase [Chloroflexota bacterium]|nr:alpha/beta fold hydrolase [Chloroflexota bacterium]